MPQITGVKTHSDRIATVAEWYDEFRDYTVPGRMICDEDYKYICYLEPDSEELYDMRNDRYEKPTWQVNRSTPRFWKSTVPCLNIIWKRAMILSSP